MNPTACADGSCLRIHGDIGDSLKAADIIDKIHAFTGDELHVHIHSNGGDVWDGLAIYNELNRHPARIVTHVDGVAASMASIIALAGDEIRMAENAMMMIHNPEITFSGDAASLKGAVGLMENVQATLAKVYQAKSGKPMDEVLSAMARETWMTPDEAKAWHFCHAVDGESEIQTPLDETVRIAAARRDMKPAASVATPADVAKLKKEINMARKSIKAEDMPVIVPELPVEPTMNMDSPEYLAGFAAGKAAAAAEAAPPVVPPEIVSEGELPEEEKEDEPVITAEEMTPEEKKEEEAIVAELDEEEKQDPEVIAKCRAFARAKIRAKGGVRRTVRVADIRAAFNGEKDFVYDALEMAERGCSMSQIKAKYADILAARNAELSKQLKAATTGQGPVGTSGVRPVAYNPNDPKAVAASEYDRDPQIRASFSSKANYVNVRTAELTGKFRQSGIR